MRVVKQSTIMDAKSTSERKWKKYMVEKRRRTRINLALLELKELTLEYFHKDSSKYDKMEKADILDLTVQYLERIHQQLPPKGPIRPTPVAATGLVRATRQFIDLNNNLVPESNLASWGDFNESTPSPLAVATGSPLSDPETTRTPTDVTAVSRAPLENSPTYQKQDFNIKRAICGHIQQMSPEIGFRPPEKRKLSSNKYSLPALTTSDRYKSKLIKPRAIHATNFCGAAIGGKRFPTLNLADTYPHFVLNLSCKSRKKSDVVLPSSTRGDQIFTISDATSGAISGFSYNEAIRPQVPP